MYVYVCVLYKYYTKQERKTGLFHTSFRLAVEKVCVYVYVCVCMYVCVRVTGVGEVCIYVCV